MSRYIDADKLYIAAMDTNFYDAADEDVVLDLINQQPTADVQEVKRGEWKTNSYEVCCSECGAIERIEDYQYRSNICPNCGAKMYKDKQQ